MKPLSNYLLVEPFEENNTSAGGLYIPETAKEKPVKGKVLAVGPGRTENGIRIPLEVIVGDSILYGKYSGVEVSMDGKKGLLIREHEALAIL